MNNFCLYYSKNKNWRNSIMKKTLSILLALLMVFSVVLTGCTAGETAKTGENGEPVATEKETQKRITNSTWSWFITRPRLLG